MTELNGAHPNGAHSNEEAQMEQPPMPQIRILSQYVKDLSFEDFKSPQRPQNTEQKLMVHVQLGHTPMLEEKNLYEVTISVAAYVGEEEDKFFHIEVLYGGLFELQNVSQASLEPFLRIEAPRYLFPFLRHVLATTTLMSGLPPLMIEPVDFVALYEKHVASLANDKNIYKE